MPAAPRGLRARSVTACFCSLNPPAQIGLYLGAMLASYNTAMHLTRTSKGAPAAPRTGPAFWCGHHASVRGTPSLSLSESGRVSSRSAGSAAYYRGAIAGTIAGASLQLAPKKTRGVRKRVLAREEEKGGAQRCSASAQAHAKHGKRRSSCPIVPAPRRLRRAARRRARPGGGGAQPRSQARGERPARRGGQRRRPPHVPRQRSGAVLLDFRTRRARAELPPLPEPPEREGRERAPGGGGVVPQRHGARGGGAGAATFLVALHVKKVVSQ